MRRIAVVCWLALAGPLWAQSVKAPAEVKTPVGRLAAVVIEWEGVELKWTAPDKDLDVFREYDQNPQKVRLRIIAYKAGTYKLSSIASGPKGQLSEFAHTIIIAGDAPPPGPDPGPGPGPTPPKPEPTDEFYKALKAAWLLEPEATRKGHLDKLLGIYDGAVSNVSSTTANVDAYMAALTKARQDQIGDALPKLRAAVSAKLNADLPRPVNTPFTDELRKQYKTAFELVVHHLEALP